MQSDASSVVRSAKLTTDSEDASEDLDDFDNGAVSEPLKRRRRKRHYSRPRIKRTKPAPSSASQETTAVSAVESTAQDVAKRIGSAKEDDNLDMSCSVAGVTHRGGFKLRVVGVEELTSAMLDRWRAVCASKGYASSVSFDVTASEAVIVATPLFVAAKSSWLKCVPDVDPLNAIFLGALALNALRHALEATV